MQLSPVAIWRTGLDYVEKIEISPEGKIIITKHSHAIGIWTLPEVSHLVKIAEVVLDDNGYRDGIEDMAVNFSTWRLACWNAGNEPGKRWLRLVDLQTGKTLKSKRLEKSITMAVFHPSENYLIAGLMADQYETHPGVNVWESDGLTRVTTLPGHEKDVDCIAVSPNGRWLATAGLYTEEVCIWDLQSNRLEKTLDGPSGNFEQLFWSADGTKLFASLFGRSAIWETNRGFRRTDIEARFMSESSSHDYVAFICSGSTPPGYFVMIWNLEEMKRVAELARCTSHPESTVISPDGRLLLTGSNDLTASLWDIRTGIELARYTDIDYSSISFHPSGDVILGSRSDLIQVFPVPSQETRQCLLEEQPRKQEERLRKKEETRQRLLEEQRRKQEELLRKEEENNRRVEKMRETQALRKLSGRCVMCGQPLGFLARLFRRTRHRGCNLFWG